VDLVTDSGQEDILQRWEHSDKIIVWSAMLDAHHRKVLG
jgi:hypothetical protein